MNERNKNSINISSLDDSGTVSVLSTCNVLKQPNSKLIDKNYSKKICNYGLDSDVYDSLSNSQSVGNFQEISKDVNSEKLTRNHLSEAASINNNYTTFRVESKEEDIEQGDSSQFWKELYMNQIRDSLNYEETIKTLFEENRLNQEYIIGLESRLSSILNKSNNITNNFHNNLSALFRQFSMIGNNSCAPDLSDLKSYLSNAEDYKSQLDILAEEKDNLTANLSLSRHQYLQSIIKIDELQGTVVNLQKQILNLK